MKPKLYVILLCFNCLVVCVICDINPACQCVVFQSYGRSKGVFTSPNFNTIYPSGINCILYTFIGDIFEIVELSFLEFDLQVPSPVNKCGDYLKFFLDLERPEVNQHNKYNYVRCGNISMIEKKHYSSGRSLILEFHTDHIQANNTGFRGRFAFLEKAQFETVGGTKDWGSDCNYYFSSITNRTGQFFSFKYPQNYPPNANCQYVFYGAEDERVKVIFKNIQLESTDGGCSSSPDSISVHDGMDSTASVINQYCTTVLNGEEVISSGRNLYIEFKSDSKEQRQGFAATFEFIKMHQNGRPESTVTYSNDGPDIVTDCNFTFTSRDAKEGEFMSPEFGRLSYPSNSQCVYTFSGDPKERVQLEFVEFDLSFPYGDPEHPSDCERVDNLRVDVIDNRKSHNLGIFCGKKRPDGNLLMSFTNVMEVLFTSHTGSYARGFKINYRFLTDFGITFGHQNTNMLCKFEFYDDKEVSGEFTSPNYPGKYPRNTECHYLFQGHSNTQLYIEFKYFYMEGVPPACDEKTDSDYVEFSNFNIGLPDRKMRRFCGDKNESPQEDKTVSSDGAFFRVTFKSNDVYDATGFEAFYQFRKKTDYSSVVDAQPPNAACLSTPSLSLHFFAYLLATVSLVIIL